LRISGRFVLILMFIFQLSERLHASENIIILIIDGARYSETFGDPDHTYIPEMAEIAAEGTLLEHFYNESVTYTSRAIPALWCGSWTEVNNIYYNGINTKHAVKPTIFEYYRKGKNKPAEECFYVIKQLSSLWLASFDPDYGPDYWPEYHSAGSTDAEVASEAEYVMDTYHPPFLLIYLADVDSYGHSGNWESYTNAIQKADSITGLIWQKAQADPFYKDKTTLFVTNDHGRHDDQHGGFSGHGDGCDGCRHIMFLAAGPEIKSGFSSSVPRRIPDMAVTVGHILDFEKPKATGEVMAEILKKTDIKFKGNTPSDFALGQNYPNPFNPSTTVSYQLSASDDVDLSIYNNLGQKVYALFLGRRSAGIHQIKWNAQNFAGGIYFCRMTAGTGFSQTRKLVLLK